MTEWREVTESEPDSGAAVILWAPTYARPVYGWRRFYINPASKAAKWATHSGVMHHAPTHWMPLPEPPK